MEQLIQRHIKYFYVAFACVIFVQLILVIFAMLNNRLQYDALAFISLSIVNIILLIDSIKHNIRQQFTECKVGAKILRFTIGLLMASHMLLYFRDAFNWVTLMDHIMIAVIAVIILNYRIKTIEYLEKRVSHLPKSDIVN